MLWKNGRQQSTEVIGEQGRARLTFDYQHEIITLTGEGAQSWGGIGVDDYPAIAAPKAGDISSLLLDALQAGGHFISVDFSSDMPFIGIIDKSFLLQPTAPENDSSFQEHLVVIGYEPVELRKPIRDPLIVAPMVRFFLGEGNTCSRYNLGGEGAAGLLDSSDVAKRTDIFSFTVRLHIDPRRTPRTTPPPQYVVTNLIMHGPVVADGAGRSIQVPLLYLPSALVTKTGQKNSGTATGTIIHVTGYTVTANGVISSGVTLWDYLTATYIAKSTWATKGNTNRLYLEFILKDTTGTAPVQAVLPASVLTLQAGGYYV